MMMDKNVSIQSIQQSVTLLLNQVIQAFLSLTSKTQFLMKNYTSDKILHNTLL